MNAPKLQLVVSRAENLEAALSALTNIIADEQFPADVRKECALAHRALHACRSPQTVRAMERDMGITTGGDAA